MSATTLQTIPTGVYNVDPTHSNVGFEVRHMGIATVRGKFATFEGKIDASGDSPVLEGRVDVSTIDTGDENRDGHLKGAEFFDAEQHPQISFHGTTTEAGADGRVTLKGEITIKGVTKPIELTGELAENGEDPWGNQRIGLEGRTEINRKDWGVNWNAPLEAGGILVSEKINLELDVSAVRQA